MSHYIELRSSFSPQELSTLYNIFSKEWINNHPITSILDLSEYPFDSEDIKYFALLYNNPLNIQGAFLS